MKTITSSQIIERNGDRIELPKVGDCGGPKEARGRIVAVRIIGKARRGLHLGQFLGLIQKYEIDIEPIDELAFAAWDRQNAKA